MNKYLNEINLFNIQEIITVAKFTPKSNEKYYENEYIPRTSDESGYLSKKEQFGEKLFVVLL